MSPTPLVPDSLLLGLPPLYAQEKLGDQAVVHLKLFSTRSHWTWYVTEYDPATRVFFGLVQGFETELGYFSLDEMAALPAGYIERDAHFSPVTLAEIRQRLQSV